MDCARFRCWLNSVYCTNCTSTILAGVREYTVVPVLVIARQAGFSAGSQRALETG